MQVSTATNEAITPRPYQNDCVAAVFEFWNREPGIDGVAQLPTAAGKTVISAIIMHQLFEQFGGCRILFLAHRKELIESTEQKLKAYWPAAPCGVYAASMKRRELSPITIASRDTLAPVIAGLNCRFDLVIIDECHNVSTDEGTQYQKILGALRLRNPATALFGITATPFRHKDGHIVGAGGVFDKLIYRISMRELLAMGHLARLRNPKVSAESKVDTSDVAISGGEFNQKQLAAKSINHAKIAAAIGEWYRLAYMQGRRHTLFFAVNVSHAEAIQAELMARGFDVPLVTGKTPTVERAASVGRFLSGAVVGLLNVGVFTEGTDFPLIDCIANLRAVNSLGLWLQMAGRGMRTSPDTGKVDCMLLDFGGCIERFGPIDTAQPPARRGTSDQRTKDCPECNNVCGFLKFTCDDCGYRFADPPVPVKICPDCLLENKASADICIGCGAIFASNSSEASDGAIMSDEIQLAAFKVTRPLYAFAFNSPTKKATKYLKVTYQVSLNKAFHKNLYIGYPGSFGNDALRDFARMSYPGTPEPTDVEHARRLILAGCLLPVDVIHVDTSGQYAEIKSIEYREVERA